MFHLVFSGPEKAAAALVAALNDAGYPSQQASHHGFDPEPLTVFVEALGDPSLVDDASRVARAHGYTLRLHGTISAPELPSAADRLEARLAELEARLAALTEGAR